ncbi:MAG TPA: hypothetical protein VEK57_27100 [Thermoanaerobaculia bacterium]|nr:hypothetical protein [Thermoanaerobaculia bacterium]
MLATIAILLVGIAACRTSSGGKPPAGEIYGLDRAGFVQELVSAQPTPRTAKFDDYTEGSYHVNKRDLLEGIRERRRAGTPIVAAVIRGPVGPLWAYDAKLFIRERDGIRVNTVWMPHARITHKSTALISVAAFDELYGAIANCDALVEGDPDEKRKKTLPPVGVAGDAEWSYDLLAAVWDHEHETVYSSTALYSLGTEPPPSLIHLHEMLERALRDAVVTYPPASQR